MATIGMSGVGHMHSGQLLRRARAELDAADAVGDQAMRFLHAHMAAIRAASAVLASVATPQRRRRRVLTVWEQLAEAGSEWESWASLFAAGAPVRAAIEAGRIVDLDESVAEAAVSAAVGFVDEVAAATQAPRVPAPLAS